MAWVRGFLFSSVVLGVGLVACAEDPPPSVLQPLDLTLPEGEPAPFDRNAIIEPGALTDYETLDAPTIQRFLARTAYQRRSFLETYQSNGVRASDAIASAARVHRINPLAFLAFAQATQGLVSERNYPFPPERVEYVFRCGCRQAGNCLPELAGFDNQVDCLGRALRAAIDEIRANDKTNSGWGPEITSLTLDNLKVTPANDATAALYDRLPIVNVGKGGGLWVFWNIWNHYALELDYVGPSGGGDGHWIGEPCQRDAMCSSVPEAICADNYPDGLCTVKCTGQCPSQPGKPETFCAKFSSGGYCLQVCNPAAKSCREGYTCVRATGMQGTESGFVCSAEPLGG